ncbi:paired amphipathic helix protein Sin3-like 2 [Bidens hawaiensis]|uniref:paired amphipathic helix protein Sin3-like 2 n=1 Tax=Bidens hawaiensis TaxID=980011 RepID=UPI00404A7470
MKRLRDDNNNSQIKRPSSPGESYGPFQVPGGRGKLTTSDALTYLKEVKDMFQDQREKYDMFLDAMKDFKAQRIDTTGVIARVKSLFKGHNNLIFGFNTFLPKGYEITVIEDDEPPPKKAVEFDEAISFVNKIKKRFQNDDRVYKSFLDILNMYRKEHKGINEVYQEVASLFYDHPDLLNEFTRFLPDASAAASAHHSSFLRQTYNCYDERSSAMGLHRHTQIDKQRGRRDPSVEGLEMYDDKTMIKRKKESRDRRTRDQDFKDSGIDHRLEKRKSTRMNDSSCLFVHILSMVSDLLGRHPDLMEQFSAFMERCENMDGFLLDVMKKKALWTEGHGSKSTKTEEKERKHRREIYGSKEDMNKEKYWGKSIQELDLSNCQRCTPSYRLLPDDVSLLPSQNKSRCCEQSAHVVNGLEYKMSCSSSKISYVLGTEDYFFRARRKSKPPPPSSHNQAKVEQFHRFLLTAKV